MRKKFIAMALLVYFTGVASPVYASPEAILNTNQVTNETTYQVLAVEDEKDAGDTAGVLPDSSFYSIEIGIEKLQIAITESEEKLAELKARFATERAAEAAIMTEEGEEELASEATADYIKLIASAVEHLSNAIEAKDEAVQSLHVLNESYTRSEEILKAMLEKAPEDSKTAIESALSEQDKTIAAINGFYAAKEAFFAAKEQFEAAKKELEEAKKSGDPALIAAAEAKVKEVEALKDELEGLKDSADSAKEEIKNLVEQAEKGIESGMDQIEKANEKMDKIEEKASENDKKLAEKAKEEAKRAEEKAKKEAEKLREEQKKAEEKAREEAKKAEEKAREAAKKAEEQKRD